MLKPTSPTTALLTWMEALSDPTRLRLLRLLERHELTVNDLCDILQIPQSTVSRHLRILADRKLLRSRGQGTTHLYRLLLEELPAPARKLWLLAREQTDSSPTTEQDQLRLSRRLKDRSADAQSFFASTAARWDTLRSQLYGQLFLPAAISGLLPPDYCLADLGCGTGALAELMGGSVGRVLGIDNSGAMLEFAKNRLKDQANVELIFADLAALPIADSCCDGAVACLVLTYLAEPLRVLTESARILKTGGRLVIVDLLPHENDAFRQDMGQAVAGLSMEEMRSLLVAAGFGRVEVRPLPPEPSAKAPALFLARAIKDKDGGGGGSLT